jgi:hypothetical protein
MLGALFAVLLYKELLVIERRAIDATDSLQALT